MPLSKTKKTVSPTQVQLQVQTDGTAPSLKVDLSGSLIKNGREKLAIFQAAFGRLKSLWRPQSTTQKEFAGFLLDPAILQTPHQLHRISSRLQRMVLRSQREYLYLLLTGPTPGNPPSLGSTVRNELLNTLLTARNNCQQLKSEIDYILTEFSQYLTQREIEFTTPSVPPRKISLNSIDSINPINSPDNLNSPQT